LWLSSEKNYAINALQFKNKTPFGAGGFDAMKNIFLVLKREYLVRVRKKSFIVMTILTPVLIAAFYGIIVWAAVGSFKNERKTIEVIDQSGLFKNKFKSDKNTTFQFTTEPVAVAQKNRC
jgi:ABC-2 type transport system permease protein